MILTLNTQSYLLPFTHLNKTGCGKFGVVFLSEHVKTQKYVAIKYISQQQIFSGKFASRIQQVLQKNVCLNNCLIFLK